MTAPYAATAAEIAAALNPADETRALIEESDRLLDVLETLNLDGRKLLTDAAANWTADLYDRVRGYPLPLDHEARERTQAALEHVLDKVQEVLFERHRVACGFPRVYAEPEEGSDD